jgi:hypothetical protein
VTRIPRSFQLLGHTIRVEILSVRAWQELGEKYDFDDAVGYFSPTDKLVLIKRGVQSEMLHTFAHELLHAILDSMNSKLSNDEVFVDNFGGLLAQALATFER